MSDRIKAKIFSRLEAALAEPTQEPIFEALPDGASLTDAIHYVVEVHRRLMDALAEVDHLTDMGVEIGQTMVRRFTLQEGQTLDSTDATLQVQADGYVELLWKDPKNEHARAWNLAVGADAASEGLRDPDDQGNSPIADPGNS